MEAACWSAVVCAMQAEADEARLRDLDKRQQIMTLVGFRRVNGLLASMQNVF